MLYDTQIAAEAMAAELNSRKWPRFFPIIVQPCDKLGQISRASVHQYWTLVQLGRQIVKIS